MYNNIWHICCITSTYSIYHRRVPFSEPSLTNRIWCIYIHSTPTALHLLLYSWYCCFSQVCREHLQNDEIQKLHKHANNIYKIILLARHQAHRRQRQNYRVKRMSDLRRICNIRGIHMEWMMMLNVDCGLRGGFDVGVAAYTSYR